MSYRLILDENVENEVARRLENYGHDVTHVAFVPELGKGTSDDRIARYSLETERTILTYDDDFVHLVEREMFHSVLYITDQTLSTDQLADAVHRVSQRYPQSELTGLEFLGSEWLWHRIEYATRISP